MALMYFCDECGELYVEPEFDHYNHGIAVCPCCGSRHEDNEGLDEEDICEMLSYFKLRRCIRNGSYDYVLKRKESLYG